MRTIINRQMEIGETDISDIEFDPKSRDEIPQLLHGLQSLYCNHKVREKIFDALLGLIPDNVNKATGRKGMKLWNIFVLGCLRLNCNWDFDKVQDIANNHLRLRQMLGHSSMDFDYYYALQTVKDNISLFTPDILDQINRIVVTHGHEIIKHKPSDALHGSCDSYVAKTDVHYPTDINLLFDAARKTIHLTMHLCDSIGFSDWRQGQNNLRKIKRYFRNAGQAKRSTSRIEEKKKEKDQQVINAHKAYVELIRQCIAKARKTILSIESTSITVHMRIQEIEMYMADADRQMDQILRRVVNGESIPHHEKVFSLFQRHTEWISKGKAGVPVELGLRVCIVKDQYGFILHHKVMQSETDDNVAVPMVRETKERFPNFNCCSFDKGFHSKDNQEQLKTIIEKVVLPRKGKLSEAAIKIEGSNDFIAARRKHSAVESSINALENHGLDRCPDHGLRGFKRYIALGIVARNIQIIGRKLRDQEAERLENKYNIIKKAS